jgi:hypothetical protein
VGKRQALGAQLDPAEQEQVDVDRAGTVARATEDAPVLDLDRLADVQQRLGIELRPDAHRRVEEVGLIEDLPNGLGLVDRRDGLDVDAVIAQVVDRAPQMRDAVAEVGAEPQIPDVVAGPAQTPSSSSDSRSSERSSVTSTPASWTGYGTGGSGFAARTITDSQSKRSISLSATT